MTGWIRGLLKELEAWIAEGLVTRDQADRIRARYERQPEGPGWGMLVFSGLGAVIIGLGVILMIAYNWEAIPRLVKLFLLFAAVAGAHGAGLHLFFRKPRLRALGEALTVLGTMLFGAGIWLVAQIYHLDEHFPNGIILWGLGALSLAWILPSVAQGVLAAVLLSIWCGTETFGFDSSMHVAPGLILAGVGVLAWRMKSRVLLSVALPAMILSLGFVVFGGHGGRGSEAVTFGTLLHLGVALVGAGVLARHGRWFPEAAPILSFFGWLLFLPLLYTLTFEDAARHFLAPSWFQMGVYLWCYWTGALAIGLGAWAWIGFRVFTRAPNWTLPLDHVLVPLTGLVGPLFILLFRGDNLEGWTFAASYNLILLALIIGMMTRGCRHGLTGPTVLGSLLLVAYMFARYFDLFDNLFARGVVFIVVGGAIFAQGLIYSRVKQSKSTKELAA